MKAVVIHMVDSNGNKTNKTFTTVETAADGQLKALANKYKALTNSVLTTAEKVVTTNLALD